MFAKGAPRSSARARAWTYLRTAVVAAKHHDVVLRHLDAFRAALLWVIGHLRDRHVEAVGRLWFTKERGELSSGFCGWSWSKPLHKSVPHLPRSETSGTSYVHTEGDGLANKRAATLCIADCLHHGVVALSVFIFWHLFLGLGGGYQASSFRGYG